MALDQGPSPLLNLPAELIDKILFQLALADLGRIAQTCHLLHSHSSKDCFWEELLYEHAGLNIATPAAGGYRALFLAHYPHWFLVRQRIWFSNLQFNGKLILARYNEDNGCIEAFNVAAERRTQKKGILRWNGKVIIYDTFDPAFKLDFTVPVIRIPPKGSGKLSYRFSPEIVMDTSRDLPIAPVHKTFLFTRSLPAELSDNPSVQVWPPRILPSPGSHRIRTDSVNAFRGIDHLPQHPRDVSASTFRIRQAPEFSQMSINVIRFLRRSLRTEECHAYGTLPLEDYKPTPEKPWRGIWCGDYTTHGCEFLAVLQPDNPQRLPRRARKGIENWTETSSDNFHSLIEGRFEDSDGSEDDEDDEADVDDTGEYLGLTHAADSSTGGSTPRDGPLTNAGTTATSDKPPYRGRLEAIKLTGDPNVPRGEYTFIVPDLGEQGLLGHTRDAIFEDDLTRIPKSDSLGLKGNTGIANGNKSQAWLTTLPNRLTEGARRCMSVGHIAGRGFNNDTYIPTQVILISEDRIAQYWKPFEHVSFYQRVDIDALMDFV